MMLLLTFLVNTCFLNLKKKRNFFPCFLKIAQNFTIWCFLYINWYICTTMNSFEVCSNWKWIKLSYNSTYKNWKFYLILRNSCLVLLRVQIILVEYQTFWSGLNQFGQVQIIKISPEKSSLNLNKTICTSSKQFGRSKIILTSRGTRHQSYHFHPCLPPLF